MNPSTTVLTKTTTRRFVGSLLSALTAASMVAGAATQEVDLKLGGKKFGHNKSLTVKSFANKKIAGSKLYNYKISGTVRGQGGVLGAMFPSPVPLDVFLDSIKAGTSSLLEGTLDNPNGTLPATLVSKTFKGSRNIKGFGRVNLRLKMAAKIAANGQTELSITGIKATVSGSKIDGVLVFTKGSNLTVSTAPIVEFKATGQKAFAESAGNATITVWRQGNKSTATTVEFATVDQTAVAGLDYTATSGTVSFAAGESLKTITIPITDNATKDGFRTFTIVLSNPAAGTVLGSKTTNTVSISDND